MATTLVKRDPDAASIPIPDAQTITFAALGVGLVGWLVSFAKGRLKQDALDKIELAAAVKRADESFDALSIVVGDLKTAVAKCETHREHDGAEMARLRQELDEVKRKQNARLGPEPSNG